MKYLSVVIAYYKNPAALSLIIKALERQSYQNFEIIIAEDDKKSDLDFLVNQNLKHKIKHWQFLKALIWYSSMEIVFHTITF